MNHNVREQVISRLIERLFRAIPGESMESLTDQYAPVFRKMDNEELGKVWEKTAGFSDAQLYILDERVSDHIQRRQNSPRVGSDVCLLFQTFIKS